MTTLCYSRRTVSGLLRVLHATNKPCIAIIATGFTPDVLRKVTLSLGAFSPPKIQTSYHQSGKALPGGTSHQTRAVRLETGDGTQLQNSWNIEHLRKYYP